MRPISIVSCILLVCFASACRFTDAALIKASQNGDAGQAGRCLAHGVRVDVMDEHGNQPIHLAAKGGHDAVVKLLLLSGAKASARLGDGSTPASLADEGGHRDLAVYLMARAGEDCSESALQTALVNAAREGDEEMIKRVLAAGAKVNQVDFNGIGMPAIHWAAWKGHAGVVKLLIEKGSRVDIEDGNGRQPLHWAVMNGGMEVPRLLIAAGAKASAVSQGKTPAAMAQEKGNFALAKYLSEQAAKESN